MNPSINKQLLIAGAIVLAAVLAWQGLGLLKSPPPKKAKAPPRPGVEVMVAQFGPVQLYLHSQGTVGAHRQISWASQVAGRVVAIEEGFVEGAIVDQEQVLLRLDDTDYRAAVAEAEASLADARLALAEEQAESRRGERYRADNPQAQLGESLRQPKLQQVEAAAKAAEKKLAQARRDLAATQIVAPFAGVVDGKQVDIGQYVSAGTTLFNLIGIDRAEVRLPVTAADMGYIDVPREASTAGPAVQLTAQLGRDRQQWQGRIVRLEQRVDSETRTFYLVAAVEQPYDRQRHSQALTIGLFVDARIAARQLPRALRLPRAALHDNRYVYVVDDGRIQRREVTVYRREHDSVVLTGGVAEGEQVVLSRLDLMVEGMPVSVMNQE